MKKRAILVLVVVLAMLFVAACGNNGGSDNVDTPGPTVTDNQTPAPPAPPPQDIPQVDVAGWLLPNGLVAGLEGELVVAGTCRQFNVSDPDMGGVFEYFNEFYPNFRTRLHNRGNEGGALGHLQTLIAAGDPPDVFITDSGDIPNLVRLGMVEDITHFVERYDEFRQSLIPNAFDLNTVNGRVYGVVWQFLPRGWITNIDLFERLGIDLPGMDWTVEDFANINARLSANRSIGISGVQGEQHILVHQFLMAYNVHASTWEDGIELSAYADDPNAIPALEMVMRALFDYDSQFSGAELDAAGPWPQFFWQGMSAWQPWSLWGQPLDRNTGQMAFNWTVLPPPRGPAGHRGGNSGTITMAMFPGSPNAELAFRYIMASTSHHFYHNAVSVDTTANPPRSYPTGFSMDEIRFPVGLPPQNINHVTHPANQAALEGFMIAAEYMVQDPFSVVGIPNNQLVAYVVPGTRSMADMLREYDNWRNGYLRAGQ